MAENMTSHQYMMSGGMNSRRTGWPPSSTSNMYATPDNGSIPVLSSQFNSASTNAMSTGNQMNYAPHQASINTTCRPPSSQHSRNQANPWWQHCKISRQACVEFGKLLDAAKDEQQILNYDTRHLSRDDQFHFRKKVQAFLARLCTNQQLLECINAELFLTQFFQPYFYNIVKHVTGIDIEKMPLQDNNSPHITRQPQQVPANLGMSQVSQHSTGGGLENLSTRGNIQQFQISGMSTRGNSSFTPSTYIKPPPPYQLQGSTQTNFYQGGSVPDHSQSVVTPNVSTAMQRWYKMPAERYESGRVVEILSSHQGQQEPTGMPVNAGNQHGTLTLPAVSTYTSHVTSVASQPDYMSVRKECNYSQQQTHRSAMQQDIPSVSANSRSVPQTISQQSNVQSMPADTSLLRRLPQQQTICDSRNLGNTTRDSSSDLVPQQSVQAPATNQIHPNNSPSTSRKETSVLPDSKEHLQQLMSNTPPVLTVDRNSHVNQLDNTAKEPVVMPAVEPVVPVAENIVPVAEPIVPVVEPVAAPVEESAASVQQLSEAANTYANIISMPVIVEDQSSRKSESSKQVSSLSKQLRNSFDMNVPSPFTADVSDSVDRWLSGSKSSELLDTLTSKSCKENTVLVSKVLKDKKRPCVEKQNQNISSVEKESGESLPQSDSVIISDEMNVVQASTGSISLEHAAKHCSVEETHSENETVSKSLGIYDPPLPVIKHKKRESRISPLKKSSSNIDTDVDTSAASAAHSKGKTIESRRHSEGSGKTTGSSFKRKLEVYKASLDTEPLFSVLDNHSARKTAKSNGNRATEGKELTRVLDSEKQRHKSAEVSSSSLQCIEEKHKKSHSENRDKSLKKHERTQMCDAKKPISVSEQHVHVGERTETSKDRSRGQSQQESSAITAREKVYSQWSGNQKPGKPNSVGHVRRQSCPDKNGSKSGGNKSKRSLTWDGATPTSATLEELDGSTEDHAYLPSNGEFIWFHGQKLLMINLPDGKHLVMKEFVKCCLSNYDISHVYKTKTCTLKINHKTLTHSCRREVEKYLCFKKIQFSSQMGVVLLTNAQKLYHHMLQIKSCPEADCVSSNPPVCERSTRKEDNLVQKERSVSPDSTVQSNQQSKATTDLKSPSLCSKGNGPDDVQLNKVSSQSQDSEDTCGNEEPAIIAPSDEQEDEGAVSDVSDATDIYCDGKPVPKHSSGVTAEEIDEKDCEVIKGGFAIIQKDKLPDRTLRYIVVDGEKCYVYQDLFQLFSKEEVVKVVIHKDMHVVDCTADSAHYLSRLEPKLPPVVPGECFLIKEKYVRKVFAYFGEPYPKLKLIKNGFKRKSLPPLLASETGSHDESLSPPEKKLLLYSSPEGRNDGSGKNHQGKISNKDNSETSGWKRKVEDYGGGREASVCKKSHLDDIFNESREYILQAFVTLKEQHKQVAADLAYVKTEIRETKAMKTDLEEKCRKQEGEMTSLKSELSVSKEYNVSLEQKYKELEGLLSQLKEDLHVMKEENQALAKERDHNKDFLEKVVGAYRLIDDDDVDDDAGGID
ncbi:uncharacterized protein [Haliotis asinina]|uniref:uncharacterized protein isoform X2 n=1 Tax=Haliotis asinina TaxID=109174 RepID=UPI0035317EA6